MQVFIGHFKMSVDETMEWKIDIHKEAFRHTNRRTDDRKWKRQRSEEGCHGTRPGRGWLTLSGEMWEWETYPCTFSISERFFSDTCTSSGDRTSLVSLGKLCSGGGESSSWYRYCVWKWKGRARQQMRGKEISHNPLQRAMQKVEPITLSKWDALWDGKANNSKYWTFLMISKRPAGI